MTLPIVNKTNSLWMLLVTMSISVNYIPLQAQTGQRFKQIDYKYDLISGKVNEVHYQAGEADAFYHIYKYDADNRITDVYTSKDSVLWDHDAGYTYYAHGPLARVELGDNKVQGMDYVYTLQGWIKGVNSNLLTSENDIGNDGLAGGVNSAVAKDAFGYTLNYHDADYQPIDASKWSNTAQRFEAITPNSDLMANRFDLYNGNISSMVTTIEEPKIYTGAANEMPNILPQGTAYKYDQLNRLLEMKAFQNLTINTNKWELGSTYSGMYHNAFKYDANGNILGQFRADQAGTTIDSLTYKYVKDALGHTKQNRLYHVNDQVGPAAFTDDIDDQGPFNANPLTVNDGVLNNYKYDEIGNLSRDKQEGIDKIEWTVYGKIKSITRVTGSLKSDLVFNYDASGNRIAKIEIPKNTGGIKPVSDWLATYYVRDAQGNVMGIYILTAATGVPSFKVMERNLYGSSRMGSDEREVELVGALPMANPYIRTLGNKYFEGSNHLGNVLAVFSDRKIARDDSGDGAIDYFQGDVLNTNDFYCFGSIMPGRSFNLTSTRYGFGSQEKDNEINGQGISYTSQFWQYDSRLGRRWNLDPNPDPSISYYAALGNNPIVFGDILGDTIGVNFFSIRTFAKDLWQDIKNIGTGKGFIFYEVGSTYIKERCNDGYFAVFGHGGALGMLASSKDGRYNTDIFDAKTFDKAMTSISSEWATAKDKKETTLTLYSCDVGASEYTPTDGVPKKVVNIAQKISIAHPNIIVEAPNGEVVYGKDKYGKPTILGIDNGKGNGAFIIYKNGKEVGRKEANYNSNSKSK